MASSRGLLGWDCLSDELQQNVLLRVPWHDLCRFRVVCKAWKRMMTEPEFVSVHGTTLRPESCVLTASRIVMPLPAAPVINESDKWQLLDIAANRTFSIGPDTFIRDGLQPNTRGIHFVRRTIAASGGLIYAKYTNAGAVHYLRHVVCNPLSQSVHHVIPEPPGGHYNDIVAMVVESATQHYRIVRVLSALNARFIAGVISGLMPGEVHLYDSQAKVWTKLCDAPSTAHIPLSCVVFDGSFYALFEDTHRRRWELYSCNLETGEWRLIDVSLPRPPLTSEMMKLCPQVVAASNRLFFVGFSGPSQQAVISVTIWKIAPGANLSLTLVARLPSFMCCIGLPVYLTTVVVVAAGCGDSIVVSTFVGHRVRWDVVRRTWHRSVRPFVAAINRGAACHSFFVGAMDPDLRQMPPQ